MTRNITILLLTLLGLVSCNNYKEIKNERLSTAFIANSSPTFKGYYYEGSDSDYHYFKSKWDFEKDKYFKISVSKLTISDKYKFKLGNKELRIDVFEEDNALFGQNEFCKLYIINTVK
jgi:hypothetical protein